MSRFGPGDHSRGRVAEPVAVLQAAIDHVVQEAKQQALARVAAPVVFIPEKAFSGARPGYYFGTGPEGVGYYLDPQQRPPGAEDADQEQPETERAAPLDPEELLRQAEENAGIEEVQLLDARSLKMLINRLEKKAKENFELRLKYAEEPLKFLDNEVELLATIRGLAAVASTPKLYPLLVEGSAIPTLLGLLSHDNTDIACEVVGLLKEVTEEDAVEESVEEAGQLVDALVGANCLAQLVLLLGRLNEVLPEEATAVAGCLAVVDNMAEVRSQVAEQVLADTELLPWLLARIKSRTNDGNRQYAAEVLAILLQGHEANQQRLHKAGGIDILLQCIAPYKSRDPLDGEEEEYLENLVDALCCCLLLPACKSTFVACEGVELMFLLLKAKRASRYGALKTLDFATTGNPTACERLIDTGGLGAVFAVFMGKSRIKGPTGDKADKEVVDEVEQRAVSLIGNMCLLLTKGSRRDRLAAKFVEAEFEKVDRLMEIVFRYQARVEAAEAQLMASYQEEEEEEQGSGGPDPDELLLARMDAGLFVLQRALLAVALCWATGDAGLRRRVLLLLHQKRQSLDFVRQYLVELYDTLAGEAGPSEEQQLQRLRLASLLGAIGVDAAARQAAVAAGGAAPEGAQPVPAAAAGEGGGLANGKGGGSDVEMEVDEQRQQEPAAAAEAAARAAAAGGRGGQEQQEAAARPGRAGRGSSRQEQEQQEGEVRGTKRARVRGEEEEGGAEAARERQREREHRREKGKEPREREREHDRDRHKERERDKGRDKERERERDRGRDRDRERERDRGRDRDSGHRSRGGEDGSSRHGTSSRHGDKSRKRSRSRSRSRSR